MFMGVLYQHLHECTLSLYARDHFVFRMDRLVNAPLRELYSTPSGYRIRISEEPTFAKAIFYFFHQNIAPVLITSLFFILLVVLVSFLERRS